MLRDTIKSPSVLRGVLFCVKQHSNILPYLVEPTGFRQNVRMLFRVEFGLLVFCFDFGIIEKDYSPVAQRPAPRQ